MRSWLELLPALPWLAPGVGKIREEGERTEELSAYDIKK